MGFMTLTIAMIFNKTVVFTKYQFVEHLHFLFSETIVGRLLKNGLKVDTKY